MDVDLDDPADSLATLDLGGYAGGVKATTVDVGGEAARVYLVGPSVHHDGWFVAVHLGPSDGGRTESLRQDFDDGHAAEAAWREAVAEFAPAPSLAP